MKDETEAYLDTVGPDIHPVDHDDGVFTSIAVSLKRIADAVDVLTDLVRYLLRKGGD